MLSPLFFALGLALYRVYYLCFEKRGQESLRGLAFFFGILFITEVALILVFGVDYRMVSAAYQDTTMRVGPTAGGTAQVGRRVGRAAQTSAKMPWR